MLAQLVRDILEFPDLQRFRLSSIEPASITDELIELMAGHDKFARHFHIPLQSASDTILSRMRRRYTANQFSTLIDRISRAIPECGIGTDVICGFPGETDEDFQKTFDCLARLPITYVHPFTYSARPGSEAENFADQVPGEVKKRRTRALKRLLKDKQEAFRERHLGKTLPVLMETSRRDNRSHLAGWTDNYLRVDLGEGEAKSVIENVQVFASRDGQLLGRRLPSCD
jgi:threonylcarbamoyladenosine tRNA methylthiotransferase MtaB